MHNRFHTAIFSIAMLLLAGPRIASAQGLPAMGPPIKTTIILTKPAPDETYGDKTTVTMGVGDKTYKFILKDGYTDDLKVRWPDIWQSMKQFNPNFVVQGQDAETFAKIQPGQTVKVSGAFAPLDRTFEVLTVEQGGGSEQRY
jgi:hypothetical protein